MPTTPTLPCWRRRINPAGGEDLEGVGIVVQGQSDLFEIIAALHSSVRLRGLTEPRAVTAIRECR